MSQTTPRILYKWHRVPTFMESLEVTVIFPGLWMNTVLKVIVYCSFLLSEL